jgi:hypothetical protein
MWDRISDQARSIRPTDTAKRVTLAPLWLAGAVIGAAAAAVWAVIRWVAAAVKVGVVDGTRGSLPRWDAETAAQWALVAAVVVGIVLWVR